MEKLKFTPEDARNKRWNSKNTEMEIEVNSTFDKIIERIKQAVNMGKSEMNMEFYWKNTPIEIPLLMELKRNGWEPEIYINDEAEGYEERYGIILR